MSLPEHQNPSHSAAIAPYNFVPLSETVIAVDPQTLPDHDVDDPRCYSGYIDCALTTASPVYVRCGLTLDEFLRGESEREQQEPPPDQQARNKPDFFYADPDKTPRIPGSSMRGMLRGLVEIVSYSRINMVSDRRLVYRAMGDTTSHGTTYRNQVLKDDGKRPNQLSKPVPHSTPLAKAGYLVEHKGSWSIRPAQEIGGVSFARIMKDKIPPGRKRLPIPASCKNTWRLYFKPGRYEYQDVRGGSVRVRFANVLEASAHSGAGFLEGALMCSGHMEKKKLEAVIYPPDLSAPLIPLTDNLVRDYRDQLTSAQVELLGDRGLLHDGQPVFYVGRGPTLSIGHTMMMRLIYRQSLSDLLPAAHRNEVAVDFCEAIFGYTKSAGKDKERAYASRVFVSDAVLQPSQSGIHLTAKPFSPKILASPKPTTFQHYLTQQKPDEVVIDQTKDGPKYQRHLSDYDASARTTTPRGHKLYWHKGEVTAAEIQEELEKLKGKDCREADLDTQHTCIWPVAAGVRFTFRISFMNLSEQELGALLWALTLPGDPGKQYCHSVGMGKPYGLGAVQITPALYLEDRAARYRQLFGEDGGWRYSARSAEAEEADRFMAAFEKFVLGKLGESHQRLASVKRMQMLLKMLEWPGPDRERTQYLEIEHKAPNVQGRSRKWNEYKGRPVLPDPLYVETTDSVREFSRSHPVASQERGRTTASAVTESNARQSAAPTAPASSSALAASVPQQTAPQAPIVQPKQKGASELSKPTSADELEPGMYIEGRVVAIETSRVVVEIAGVRASLPFPKIVPPVADRDEAEATFTLGTTLRVWVEGTNKKNVWQLTMRSK